MENLPEQQKPAYVKEVKGELKPGCWEPESLSEWLEVQHTSAILSAWVAQQGHERELRRTVCIWVFTLISVQIFAVFAVVLFDGFSQRLNAELVKFLIPSVLGEVFGMGFVVVKYLFRPTDLNPLVRPKRR